MPTRGFKSLQRKLDRLASDLEDEVTDAAYEGAQEVAAQARSNVQAQNAVWTESLLTSIYTTRGTSKVTIAVDAPHAPFVEFGTGPRGDPTAPPRFTYGTPEHTPELTRDITEWVMTKPMFFGPRTEGVAWAIATTIAEKGTYAHPFLRPAWFQGESALLQNVRLAFKKEIRRA